MKFHKSNFFVAYNGNQKKLRGSKPNSTEKSLMDTNATARQEHNSKA